MTTKIMPEEEGRIEITGEERSALWVDEEEGASSMIVSAPQRPSTSITQGYLAGRGGAIGEEEDAAAHAKAKEEDVKSNPGEEEEDGGQEERGIMPHVPLPDDHDDNFDEIEAVNKEGGCSCRRHHLPSKVPRRRNSSSRSSLSRPSSCLPSSPRA